MNEMRNLDAFYDNMLAKHLAKDDYDPPWSVDDYDGEGGGYIVVDEDGVEDKMGYVFDTQREAHQYATELNEKELTRDDYY